MDCVHDGRGFATTVSGSASEPDKVVLTIDAVPR